MAISVARMFRTFPAGAVLIAFYVGANALASAQAARNSARPRIIKTEQISEGTLRAADLTSSSQALNSVSDREIEGVEQTLERYQAAFEKLSLSGVRQVWPALDRAREAQFKQVFEAFQSSGWTRKLEMSCSVPVFAEEAASVECVETITYGSADETPRSVGPNRVGISLKKGSDTWVIENMKGLG
jgi:hypothetical protein